ncbi:MAG: antibiotic biosynthesis monooxygenase [Desulfotalea sp.]
MIDVLAFITIKDGMVDDFLKIFKANVPAVLAEDGCVAYAPMQDVMTDIQVQQTNDNVVTIIEKWKSVDSLKAHLLAPHMFTYKEDVKDLVVDVNIKILQEA